MESPLFATLLAVLVAAPVLAAPQKPQSPPSAPTEKGAITLTGCVSAKPAASGQYTFAEADGLQRYRLTGKAMRKYAGQRVEIVSRSGKGLRIKGGLWPPPSGGARGVAQDPGREAIAIQQAHEGTHGADEVPEFRVSKVRPVPGACE